MGSSTLAEDVHVYDLDPVTKAFGIRTPNSLNTNVFVDSGATKTIICNIALLCNIRACANETILGVGGEHETSLCGDYWMAVPHAANPSEKILLKGCLFVPDAGVNLVSVHELSAAGVGCKFPRFHGPACLDFASAAGEEVTVGMPGFGNLYMVGPAHAAFQLKNLTREELWHWRLAHFSAGKIVAASGISFGFGKPLQMKNFGGTCAECTDSNIIRADAAGPSSTIKTGGWSVDLVDMGDCLSVSGNRYLTIFCTLDTRFVRVFCHKTKAEFPTILLRALAQATTPPTFLRSDEAGEYLTPAVDAILLARGIDRQLSNAHEQAQNARVETLVHAVGKGVRSQLHSANLPPEFWGFAAQNFVDIYNRLPHDGLDGVSPWALEKGTQPDFTWFRPFGCRATVFLGKQRAEHHKVAPRGEACIFVGLGFSQGQKGWILFAPGSRKVYCTKNAIFDETFLPMRVHDQRIRSHNDPTTRTRMLTEALGGVDAALRVPAEIDRALGLPFSPCARAIPQLPASPLIDVPFENSEADPLIAISEDTVFDAVPVEQAPSGGSAQASGGAGVGGGAA